MVWMEVPGGTHIWFGWESRGRTPIWFGWESLGNTPIWFGWESWGVLPYGLGGSPGGYSHMVWVGVSPVEKVTEKGTVTNLLKELGWPSLEHRRKYHRLDLFYKTKTGKTALQIPDQLNRPMSRPTRAMDSACLIRPITLRRQLRPKLLPTNNKRLEQSPSAH